VTVRFIYAQGDTASKLAEQLSTYYPRIETREQTIAAVPHLVFTIPEKIERPLVEVNEPNAIKLALSPDAEEILQLNRLKDPAAKEDFIREYKVIILNLNPIKVWKRESISAPEDSKNWSAIKIEEDNKEIKRITTAARIAVQSLGLDFGLAHVMATNKSRKPVITRVDPSPVLTPKTLKTLAKFLAESPYKPQEKEVTLGADPEFILINRDTGKMIPASQFFPRFGTVGCDSVRIPNRQQRPIGEVRPEPSTSPLVLAENIRKTLMQAIKLLPYNNIEWLAGSQPASNYPIGGHIHFSNIELSSKLLRALDNYLAIPVMLLEDPATSKLRRTKYGLLSDFRIKEYGGFEYRTISSWLVTPEISKGVLCLSKLIASNYTALTANHFTRIDLQKAFYDGDKLMLRDAFNQTWKAIMALPQAKEYASYLEPLYDMCQNMQSWDESVDIRETWGIPIPQKKYRGENKSHKKIGPTRVNVRVR